MNKSYFTLIDVFYEEVILTNVSEFLTFHRDPSNSRFLTPGDSGFALPSLDRGMGSG